MNEKRYKTLIYSIALTIAATIAIQVYWNIQQYRANKQRLINEVQISLDNGIEAYYSDLARTDIMTVVSENNVTDTVHGHNKLLTKISATKLDSNFAQLSMLSSELKKKISGVTDGFMDLDSIHKDKLDQISDISLFEYAGADSFPNIRNLTSKIIISISNDSLDFELLDDYLQKELERKSLDIYYAIEHLKQDTLVSWASKKQQMAKNLSLSTYSKSTYLPKDETLKLKFSNPTLLLLKQSFTGILLSLFLSLSIVFCLLFLLKTIKQQKNLATIKNDLISNITHEFKTPIATATTAIEGIRNFNASGDSEKTNKYLDISNQQLQKLHLMVEKLLETATLDSDKLIVNKEDIDLSNMLRQLVEKHQMLTEKEIQFSSNISELTVSVDPFHFENAITNLIDNAVKYGGDKIEVNLNSLLDTTEIIVADNGGSIDKGQSEKIFDKFYRISKGNLHDVKGFGIGLFYTKKIIEKHEGNIELLPDSENTIFKVTL